MYTRLTPPRRENHVEETIEQEIAELSRMTVGQKAVRLYVNFADAVIRVQRYVPPGMQL